MNAGFLDDLFSQVSSVLGVFVGMVGTIFDQGWGFLHGLNGPMATGVVIGFVAALFLRGIVFKLLMVGFFGWLFLMFFGR